MTETLTDTRKKPGIVIFAAILQFFGTAAFYSLGIFCGLAMLFGAALGIDKYVADQMAQMGNTAQITYGLALVFGICLVFFLILGTFFLLLGLSLLKGRKWAWFVQVASSTLGLLSLPVGLLTGAFMLPLGSLINIVILVFFFQKPVREYFRI